LTEPVIGFVDVITGGTNIRLNVTCGEGTAEFAKAESTDTLIGSSAAKRPEGFLARFVERPSQFVAPDRI
jgi:hypothetical protein